MPGIISNPDVYVGRLFGNAVALNGSVTGAVVAIKESAEHGYALSLENRDSSAVWKIGVDAAAIGDKKFFLFNQNTTANPLVIAEPVTGGAPFTWTILGTVSVGSHLTVGAAYGTPADGSIWYDGANFKARKAGTTVTLL